MKSKHVWRSVNPANGAALHDARLQLHHAAQLVAGLGISYLPKQADDSHTNMQWIAGTLASNPVGPRPFRLAVRPHVFALVIIGGDAELSSFALHGKTIDAATKWLRGQLQYFGLDPAAYTLAKHYTIPPHPVADGRPFDASDAGSFAELRDWFGDAAMVLGSVAGSTPGASPVRCWPHHFDIATLIAVAPGKTVGVGMEPGDTYYDEPYWYVNMSPASHVDRPRPELGGNGVWHTRDWIGAVLPASRLGAADEQQAQVAEFIESAIRACTNLLPETGAP